MSAIARKRHLLAELLNDKRRYAAFQATYASGDAQRSSPTGLQFVFMFERKFEQRVVSAQIEFAADVGAMIFDGAEMDKKIVGDCLARFIIGNHLQNPAFGLGQAIYRRSLLDEILRGAAALNKK
jgi:hypothetical protein